MRFRLGLVSLHSCSTKCVTRRNRDPAQFIIAEHDVQILYFTTEGCFTETKIFSDLIPGVEF